MCEFLSWKEYQGEILFLTDEIIAPRLEDYKKFNPGWRDDLCGHGAIEWYHGLTDGAGKNRECTDFSSPKNFPAEIARALKNGEITYSPMPKGLLRAALDADYRAKRDALDAEQWKLFKMGKNRSNAWK